MKNNNLEIYWSVYACSPTLLVIKSELGKMDVLWENWTSLNGHRFEYLNCNIMALLSNSRGYCLTSVKLQLFFLTKDTLLAKTTLSLSIRLFLLLFPLLFLKCLPPPWLPLLQFVSLVLLPSRPFVQYFLYHPSAIPPFVPSVLPSPSPSLSLTFPLYHNTIYCGLLVLPTEVGTETSDEALGRASRKRDPPRRDARGEGGRSASDSRARIFRRESSPHTGIACTTHRGERQEAGNK